MEEYIETKSSKKFPIFCWYPKRGRRQGSERNQQSSNYAQGGEQDMEKWIDRERFKPFPTIKPIFVLYCATSAAFAHHGNA